MPPLTVAQQAKVDGLDPAFAKIVLAGREHLLGLGVPWDITSGRRTEAEQARLFEEKPNLALPAGRSKHELGFAADLSGPRGDGEWVLLGETYEALGLTWGGRWSRPEVWHVEAPQQRSVLASWQGSMLLIGLLTVGLVGFVTFRRS